ncbi:50S ribosomal protein L15 [Candidatus Campbellbacteria bacterium]|nr:MAG: 50S ribosomal protein L15 [Candidatus Campbellbacteria bacterium]
MQINELKKNSPNKSAKRVGRGGKRGKTSGKGHKGQKARTGNSTRPQMRDIIKKFPKLRGQGVHGNKNREILNKYFAINLSEIEKVFENGDVVNPETLNQKGLLPKQKGKIVRGKILGNGELTKKLTIENLLISKTAQKKVEDNKGEVK